MARRLSTALLAPALLALAGAAPAASPCADTAWRSLFPAEGLTCVEARHGVAIAPAGEAESLAVVIDEAAARFERHFGTPQRPIAVIAGGGLTPAQLGFFRERGYRGFPWLSAAQRRTLARPRIREQLAARRPELTGEALEAAVERALAQLPSKSSGLESGALAHELGHVWFQASFEGDAPDAGATNPPATLRYGSHAPDWIDEMAAVLAENEELVASRRAGLPALMAGSGDEGFYPLADYFRMDHPSMSLPDRDRLIGKPGERTAGARVVVAGRDDPQRIASSRRMLRFYTQSRAIADYLLDRSGDDRVFLAIAQGLSRGETLDAWLARDGARYRLPTSVAALAADWEAWARAR